ncbi:MULTISPECIES: GlxA family transcriptional regulator [Spirosoma]|uniref:Helix-turn-helix domain-containing protein n=1 Tax=Spirosoma sordidisoli TaxID=2502893 RepID=A0A4Q2UVJ1_9BACT|nr:MULTISPECIES: helix-turn-helix domain-containing protein [Spirosoma]RYC71885.1 helix-turn-helix domain-containing protein [Spirosoma sordidisoli]
MKRISLLVYEDAVLSSVSGAIDLLLATNGYLQQLGKSPAFSLELVSEKSKHIQLNVPAQLICYKTLDEVTDTDLILVPAFYGSPDLALAGKAGMLDWLRTKHAAGIEIASLCLGSYLLAEAGILSGKACTSHWMAIDDMQRRYTDVQVLADAVVTDRDGIYTSGGALLSWNLILYLIEKFCGHEVSIGVSRMFNIDLDRSSQAYFVVFQGQRQHEDEAILKAQTFIEKNYHRPISVDQIAEQTNMSKRNFIRRFKNATQNTPLEYLQRVKIESAKKALEKNADDVTSLMYNAGYNDVKTFRKVFKQITGLTPLEYRKKYSRRNVATV